MTCFSVGVLIFVVIMLVICLKRKAQYGVTGTFRSNAITPLVVKDGKNGSELMFPNPTYTDCENHNNKFDQKAD